LPHDFSLFELVKSYPDDPRRIFLERIVASFIGYILENEQAARYAYGKAEYVERRITLPFCEVTKADVEKVLYHGWFNGSAPSKSPPAGETF
jgi:hypothetical protein